MGLYGIFQGIFVIDIGIQDSIADGFEKVPGRLLQVGAFFDVIHAGRVMNCEPRRPRSWMISTR